jgi:hypothetical protein
MPVKFPKQIVLGRVKAGQEKGDDGKIKGIDTIVTISEDADPDRVTCVIVDHITRDAKRSCQEIFRRMAGNPNSQDKRSTDNDRWTEIQDSGTLVIDILDLFALTDRGQRAKGPRKSDAEKLRDSTQARITQRMEAGNMDRKKAIIEIRAELEKEAEAKLEAALA